MTSDRVESPNASGPGGSSTPPAPTPRAAVDAAVGCLLGVAVADALGLPMEGLSRRRLARWHPQIEGHRLLFRRGLCSDDTEHNAMVALSVAAAGADVAAFGAQMRGRMRWWLLALPAGVGLATLRAILKLWLFLPERWQGVHSAGNGAAMRAPLLGVLFAERPDTLRALVRTSTRLTHTDPKAEAAALAVALAARAGARGELDAGALLPVLRDALAGFGAIGVELLALLERAVASAQAGESSLAFADSIGLSKGVTGYAWHTVPVALHASLRHPRDYRQAVAGVIACGGDTDTLAAIVGGIVGAGVGREGIPSEWCDGVIEWPARLPWLERVAEAAALRAAGLPSPRLQEPPWLLYVLRNLAFMLIVLAHGSRRLLPPW